MNEFNRVAVIGAGAVGVLPAAKFLTAPRVDLRVVADSARVERYRRDAITLNGARLDFRYLAPGEEDFIAELVVVATKAYSLADAIEVLRSCVQTGSVVLPLLNGITAAAKIRAALPQVTVLDGLFLGHASGRCGTAVVHDGVGTIYFGCADGGNTPASAATVSAVTELFNRAGIAVKVPLDMREAMWKKFILNIGINQTQALFRADYGMVQNSSELLSFADGLMREAAAVADRLGVGHTAEMIAAAHQVISGMPPAAKTSMLQDVLAERQTEVDIFGGEIVRLGKKTGVPTPLNARVVSGLKSVQI